MTARASKVGTMVVCVCIVLHPAIQALTTDAFVLVVDVVAGQLKFPTIVGKTENSAIITRIVTTIPIETCTSCIIVTLDRQKVCEVVFKKLVDAWHYIP